MKKGVIGIIVLIIVSLCCSCAKQQAKEITLNISDKNYGQEETFNVEAKANENFIYNFGSQFVDIGTQPRLHTNGYKSTIDVSLVEAVKIPISYLECLTDSIPQIQSYSNIEFAKYLIDYVTEGNIKLDDDSFHIEGDIVYFTIEKSLLVSDSTQNYSAVGGVIKENDSFYYIEYISQTDYFESSEEQFIQWIKQVKIIK